MITLSSVLGLIFNGGNPKKRLPGPKNAVGEDDDGSQRDKGVWVYAYSI